ncbi:DNA replication protein [Leucoagaricus gongylophorus]
MYLALSVREFVMHCGLKHAAYICPIRWVQVVRGMALERWLWTYDEQAADLSQMLSSAFRSRLPEIIDQAHHFATLSSASGGGHKTNDTAQLFREGLDVTEREIFALAQESAKKTKKWYEESDLNHH